MFDDHDSHLPAADQAHNDQIDKALEDLNEVIAAAHGTISDAPHLVVVTDAETGLSVAYGPYPDAHTAQLSVDAVRERDVARVANVTLARVATTTPTA